MKFRFTGKKLKALYIEEKGANKYPAEVVDAFFEVMAVIETASGVRDLYAFKGLHFEKLKGKRGKENEHSLRLNDQWRLIVKIETDNEGKVLLVIDIEDYH